MKWMKSQRSTMTNTRQLFHKGEKGQSVVLIALVFVGLLAFIGLTVDMGILFISYGDLRRAVDSASLAAATQYREGYDNAKLTKSALEFLQLNNVNDATAKVETCETTPGDPALCLTNKRKLIRVTASVPVKFVFLPVVGFYGTTITAHAISEAASMDVVLVIDTSESMANDPPASNPDYKDPAVCNGIDTAANDDTDDHPEVPGGIPGECHPFEEVKAAAADNFAKWVLDRPGSEESDRLAIVTFNNGWEDVWNGSQTIQLKGTGIVCPGGLDALGKCSSHWISDQATAVNLIHNLEVYSTGHCGADYQTNGGPGTCMDYSSGSFTAIRSPWRELSNIYTYHDPTDPDNPNVSGDRSTAQTTNIGGGLKLAASMFGEDMRSDAVWLVVLLTDGAANATDVDPQQAARVIAYYEMPPTQTLNKYWPSVDLPVGFCPAPERFSAWDAPCRDKDVTTRHGSTDIANYDAEDYAKDMADQVSCDQKSPKAGCSQTGQGAVMFAIGLGSEVFNSGTEIHGQPYGDTLLRYIAAVGDDGDPGTDPCSSVGRNINGYNCGNYFFTKTGSGLNEVFDLIASKIYTRITQ